ncbi:pyridoxamine 5'-phosphate oxidase family protein [Thermocrispum agreste]|uniref:pyridoxamine 5'-phosphate oxidase family protein n=1 Tax=Thermocrispum agreste TaxID=37925 RepID=UPI00042A330A|nr:pyridoxamine 5'-phosphate oxidase family protein [Thermocrispum agreste]
MDPTLKHSLRLARMARMDLPPNPRPRRSRRSRPEAPAEAAPSTHPSTHSGDRAARPGRSAADRAPARPADPAPPTEAQQQPPPDEEPTEQLPVVRPPAFADVPPPDDPLDGAADDLPGSAGEHLLQLAYDTREQAERFYAEQMTDRLTPTMVEFVGRMEMAFIATADSRGEADCSFRAGPPGFIRVLDDKHVAYPEYRGNGVMASLGNISENPHIGILLIDFARDRVGLHINGRAMIVENDAMRAEFPDLPVTEDRGRRAERWVLVEVDEAYIHGSKHIPAMQPVAADPGPEHDDYFCVRASRLADARAARDTSQPKAPAADGAPDPQPANAEAAPDRKAQRANGSPARNGRPNPPETDPADGDHQRSEAAGSSPAPQAGSAGPDRGRDGRPDSRPDVPGRSNGAARRRSTVAAGQSNVNGS